MIDPVASSAPMSFSHALVSKASTPVVTDAAGGPESIGGCPCTCINSAENSMDSVLYLRLSVLPNVPTGHPVSSVATLGKVT